MDVINPLHDGLTDQQHELRPTATSMSGMELRQFIESMLRQRKLILSITALIIGVAFFLISFVQEQYTAGAVLVIDESQSQLLGVEAALSAGATLINRVDTEVEILKSPSVSLRTIERLKLWNDDEFGFAPSFPRKIANIFSRTTSQPVAASTIKDLTNDHRAKLVGGLKKALKISRQGFTSVISIEATSRSADKAATIANTVAESYFDLQIETRTKSAQRAAEFLRARVNELATAIIDGNQRLDEFIREHNKELGSAEVRTELARLRDEATGIAPEQKAIAEPRAIPQNIAVGLYRLERDVETNRKLYDSYVARLGEVQQQVSLAMPNSRIMSPAIAPDKPSFPPTGIFLGVAVLIGLMLGVGSAVLREHIIGGFVTPEQLAAVTGLPVTAVIPHNNQGNPHDSILEFPFSAFAESIRRMRLGIDNVTEGKHPSVVLVTSTEPSEGKTTLAIALARAMAKSAQRTLLIDCDLRQSSVGRLMKAVSPIHFVDLLLAKSMEEEFTSALAREKDSGLYLLNSESTTRHASDVLLASEQFRKLIDIAKSRFDAIIIDSPPIGYVVDASIISRECDVVLYVIRYAVSSQRSVVAGLRQILSGPRPPVPALVLNGARELLSGHYYRKSTYNNYYSEPPARI
jgi:capsular exopolysaccharide synthesis family protein